MKKRWIAAAMLEAERSFRRVKGHADMPAFVAAVHRSINPDIPANYALLGGRRRCNCGTTNVPCRRMFLP
jgi:putative transposase